MTLCFSTRNKLNVRGSYARGKHTKPCCLRVACVIFFIFFFLWHYSRSFVVKIFRRNHRRAKRYRSEGRGRKRVRPTDAKHSNGHERYTRTSRTPRNDRVSRGASGRSAWPPRRISCETRGFRPQSFRGSVLYLLFFLLNLRRTPVPPTAFSGRGRTIS